MSFRCQACRLANPRVLLPATAEAAAVHTPALPLRIVVESEVIVHPRRYDRETHGECIDRGGKGTRIVAEMIVCAPCADAFYASGQVPRPVDGIVEIKGGAAITPLETVRGLVDLFSALA